MEACRRCRCREATNSSNQEEVVMGRMKKEPKRPEKYRRIVEGASAADDQVLATVKTVMGAVASHAQRLKEARIGMLWWYNVRPDYDGRLSLGKPKKVGEADKEFEAFDFLLFVNHKAWEDLPETSRRALIDHELTHCDVSLDAQGEVKHDAKGRICWRIRKHDLEDFASVYERHGAWSQPIKDFIEAGSGQAKLFAEKLPEAVVDFAGEGKKETDAAEGVCGLCGKKTTELMSLSAGQGESKKSTPWICVECFEAKAKAAGKKAPRARAKGRVPA